MGKFTLNWGNGANDNYIPEDNGWVWVSEEISAPSPRYNFKNLGGASGSVDLSKAASGSLLYNDREINVTFARFKHGIDGWMDNVATMDTSLENAFSHTVYIFPKTQSAIKYQALGFTRSVSRDGIIQYVKLTFRIKPTGTVTT